MQLTNDVVFDDLWRRPDLSVRDRSLVTIAALAAMGDDDQLDFYLRRGLESGLSRAQIAEGLTHLGVLCGLAEGDQSDDGGHEDARQVSRIQVIAATLARTGRHVGEPRRRAIR